jgi:very-short-patch-repair endonuclease
MRSTMRKNGNTNKKEELIFKKMIDLTLNYNNINFDVATQYVITIQDFAYKPKIDLAYFINKRQIGIEVDGAYHDSQRQIFSDKYRDAKLSELGWEIYRLKHYDYEPIFDSAQLTLQVLKKQYSKMFSMLEKVFLWSTPIPDNLLMAALF